MEVFDTGVVSSKGIGIGKAYCIFAVESAKKEFIASNKIEEEKQKLIKARRDVEKQLEELIEYSKINFGDEHAELFEAHLMLFQDDDFELEILKKIEDKLYVSEFAVEEFIEENCAELLELDEYFQERVGDFKDLGRRLVSTLQGKEYNNYTDIPQDSIVIAHDLTPSMTTQIDTKRVAGFITETGGTTSHVSFIAQNLGIPAIVGASTILTQLKNGGDIILDGLEGKILQNPSDKVLEEYRQKREKYYTEMETLLTHAHEKAKTKDGTRIELWANIGSELDIEAVLKYGAEGIGLFRTEFLFLNDTPPSEDSQFEIYKKVLQALDGKPVTIRTLDVGGDKQIPFLSLPQEENPFLGYRALRMYPEFIDIIKEQLRALLRASEYGTLNIMIPMVISIEEIEWIKGLVAEIEYDLTKNGNTIGSYTLGIMIETPAAAILSELFISHVDFFSIGSNDLIQYTLAVDRGNDKISHLYQPFHPAVLRLVAQTIQAADSQEKSVSVCGDMGGNESSVIVLLILGLKKVSMSPLMIPIIKDMIRKINLSQLKEHTRDTILESKSAGEVLDHIERIAASLRKDP